MLNVTSALPLFQPAQTHHQPTDTSPATDAGQVTQRDPESLRPLPESPSMQQSLLQKLRKNLGRKNGEEESDITPRDVLDHFYAQAESEAKKDGEQFLAAVNRLEAANNISNIKPGDYCAKFANGEMLNVSMNFAAEVASVASCMATAYGLVKWLAPDATMGSSTPAIPQAQGKAPASTAAAGYSWKDMGYTSILAGSPYLMKQMYKDLYLGTAQSYLLKGRHDPVSAMEENFHNYLKQEYEPFKNDIPEDVKDAVEKIISRVLSLYNDLRPDKTKPTNMQLNDITKTRAFIGMAEYWLKSFLPLAKNGLPLMEAPGWRDGNETLEKMLETEDALKIYKDPMPKSQVRHLPLSSNCRSVEPDQYAIPQEMLDRPMKDTSELTDKDDIRDWHHWHKVENLPQKNTLLVGRAGGAKTYVKKVMEIWDAPKYDQTYLPLNEGGVAAGDPKKWRAAYQTEYITREGDLLGERVFKMFLTKYRNAMRYLDEPSWEDKEGVKRDTDPNVEKLYSECIEASYRILESCTTAMANSVPTVDKLKTTREIVKDIDPAFLSRFEVILIEECDPETMRVFSKNAYKTLAARFCLPFKDGSPAKLDEGQQKRLLSAFLSVLDRLVELHDEKKGELRMYTDVEPVFMEIVSRLLLEKASDEQILKNIRNEKLRDKLLKNPPEYPRMENADIQQWVEEYFHRMPDRNPYSKNRETDEGKEPAKEVRDLKLENKRLQEEIASLRRIVQKPDSESSQIGKEKNTGKNPESASGTSSTVQVPVQEPQTGQEDIKKDRKRDRLSGWLKKSLHIPNPRTA